MTSTARITRRGLSLSIRANVGVLPFELAKEFGERRGFQLGAQPVVGRRRVPEPFHERLEVKAGAAAQDWSVAARLDLRHQVIGESGELRGIEGLVEIADVDQVMWHAGAVGG
jgi:hypothetical protein